MLIAMLTIKSTIIRLWIMKMTQKVLEKNWIKVHLKPLRNGKFRIKKKTPGNDLESWEPTQFERVKKCARQEVNWCKLDNKWRESLEISPQIIAHFFRARHRFDPEKGVENFMKNTEPTWKLNNWIKKETRKVQELDR